MNWFRNAKTATKLMTAFGLLAVLLGIVGYEGIGAANTLNSMLDVLYQRDMVGMAAVKEAQASLLEIDRDVRQAILESDVPAIQKAEQDVNAAFSRLDDQLNRVEKSLATEEGKAIVARMRRPLQEFRASIEQVMRYAMIHNDKEATAALTQTRRLSEQLHPELATLSAIKDRLGKQAYDESDVVFYSLRRMLLMITLGGIAVCVGFGIFIARMISRPLAHTVQVLEAVADRDLTQSLTVDSEDEVGKMAKAVNQALSAMRTAMVEVRSSSEGVATAAEQLAASSEELSSGTQEQAASQEETSATIEELSVAVKRNADSARQANVLANGAREAAENGGTVVNSAVSAMAEINIASKRIVDIITTIDEIAFQTNLLALNAAVEAARAGEQGRGFAVVASEVRSLAQRSATAAKEIKVLIQDSVRKVETGSELVNRSGNTLTDIVTSVKRVTDIVAEIAAASHEQATGLEQVTKAVSQMDQVTQNNSAQTEELASTSQTLASHATEMQSLVARFRVDSYDRDASFRNAPIRPPSPPSPGRTSRSLANLSRRTAQTAPAGTPAPVASKFEEF